MQKERTGLFGLSGLSGLWNAAREMQKILYCRRVYAAGAGSFLQQTLQSLDSMVDDREKYSVLIGNISTISLSRGKIARGAEGTQRGKRR
jgi:hypothetical protein